jgi:hypothetical protein
MPKQESLLYRFWVDLDPMGPDFSPDRFPAAGSQNDTCREQRHVAINTISRDLLAHRLVPPARRRLMTLQAAAGVRGGIALRGMDLVAGRAGYGGRGQKAAAPLEQPDLVAVNVWWVVSSVGFGCR